MNKLKIYQVVMVVLLLAFTQKVSAQQDAMFTQYMFNGLALNPAYAGSHEAVSATLLYRNQWTGLDGAPNTTTFSIHSPLNNDRIAVGLQVISDKITVFNQTGVNATAAYRIPMEKGTLSFGLQAGFTSYNADLSKVEVPLEGGSSFAGDADYKKGLPNFGAGVYYYTDKFYLGFSAPQLIKSDLTNDVGPDPNAEAVRSRHFFLTTGYVFPLGQNVKFKPNALLKMVGGAPIELDLNANLLFHEVLWVGLSWRSMADIDALVEFQLTDQLLLGYSFDFANTTDLRRVNGGSHEIMLNYRFRYAKKKIISPRYF